MMDDVKLLKDIHSYEVGAFGNKCVSLATLLQHGCNVPWAIGVSANVYRAQTNAILKRYDFLKWNKLETKDRYKLARQLQEDIIKEARVGSYLEQIMTFLQEETIHADFNRIVVRSSAIGEDTVNASFAGQMKSFLNVGIADIEKYIVQCWASLWSSRAVEYRQRKEIPHENAAMAIVLQKFIVSDVSGLLFTTNPHTSKEDEILVEAVRGLGAILVDGEADPDKYILRKSRSGYKVEKCITGSQKFSLRPGDSSAKTYKVDISTSAPSLLLEQALILAKLGEKIKNIFGLHQDIEWALYNNEVFILQSRPVTTLSLRTEESFFLINTKNESAIPESLKANDKIRLRLIADTHGLLISPGWLVKVDESYEKITVPDVVRNYEQVSMVLLDPPRLNGKIHRQFSTGDDLPNNMMEFINVIRSQYEKFTFIVTEIYRPVLSGISKTVNGEMVTEVAYGLYIPKGIADTSLYVLTKDYRIKESRLILQVDALYIVDGKPHKVKIDKQPALSEKQLTSLYDATAIFQRYYTNATLEYGVAEDGLLYIIDIIPENITTEPLSLENTNILSRGQIMGKAIRVSGEEKIWQSLDAHFHSQRLPSQREYADDYSIIVVAPMPYLALEDLLAEVPANKIGFVFEKGSILGHFAIILRELKIPGVISKEMYKRIQDGDQVEINTNYMDDQYVRIT